LHAEALARLDEIEQVVAHALALGACGLRGADVHAAVDQHRVEREDLGACALGDRERELGLARRRRTDERAQRLDLERIGAAGAREGRWRS
jgi:hypothetical protein